MSTAQNRKHARKLRTKLQRLHNAINAADATDSHVERIRHLSELTRLADAEIAAEIATARAEGIAWSTIGGVQGVSGQAALRKAQRRGVTHVTDSTRAESAE